VTPLGRKGFEAKVTIPTALAAAPAVSRRVKNQQ